MTTNSSLGWVLYFEMNHTTEVAMFCPRCEAEYRPGFTKCSDCDIALVDKLPENRLADKHPRAELHDVELVVVRTYSASVDAELAKSALESVGIDSMVRSDNEGNQSPGLTFSRGAELLVRRDDVEAAEDILRVEGNEESR
jgi:hypothetical protein